MRLVPVLQIAHITDLHISIVGQVPPRVAMVARWVPRAVGLFSKFGVSATSGSAAAEFIAEGYNRHDPDAPFAAADCLRESVLPDWPGKSWLLCTGDLTTFGAEASLKLARERIEMLGRGFDSTFTLPGNHDAWPADFPFPSTTAELSRQKGTVMGALRLTDGCGLALSCLVSDVPVQLYWLDTVHWGLSLNWSGTGSMGRIDELCDQVLEASADTRAVRILALHHPIHPVTKTDQFYERVLFNEQLAAQLRDPWMNRMHVVLAGHTHALHPPPGKLPRRDSRCQQLPLQKGQLQLVGGTLMHANRTTATSEPGAQRQQFQVLRFFLDQETGEIVLKRLWFRRRTASPAFEKGERMESYRFSL